MVTKSPGKITLNDVGVALEQIQISLKRLTDGQDKLVKGQSRTNVRLRQLQDGQERLRYDLTTLEGKVDGIWLDLNGLEKTVVGLGAEFKDFKELTEAGFETMNIRFDYIDDRFDRLEASGRFYEH